MRNKFLGITAVLALGTFASADLVMDQLDFTRALPPDGTQMSTNISQVFGPGNSAFSSVTIDDFTVNASQLRVTKVDVIMSGWNGFGFGNFQGGPVTAFRVEFYSDPAAATGNLTGNRGSASVDPMDATVTLLNFSFPFLSAGLIELPVDVLLPGAGTYWVGVIPVLNFSGGNIGVMATSNWSGNSGNFPGNRNAGIANPGGAFGLPGNYQDGLSDHLGNVAPLDAEYRINAVPEPASMIALGIGIAALVARRRRKKAA